MTLQLLLRDLLLLGLGGGGLGKGLLLLEQDHLDVAGGAHVRVDATVGPVRAPAHVGSAVHLDMVDHLKEDIFISDNLG